ncbi:MAG: NAD(P)/FAD-dependent oxidoreductase [Melioribacteraceae bacterium]|nr:NAD(P)/FAD-dependent oxidoreductase [Melioribacteraceae bacterium]
MYYDFIVIGSGYGGLSAAALLVKNGFNVLLLESHSKIGGCASFYKRKDFLFDVGATTLSGVRNDQPVGILFNELGLKPKLKKIDPGIVIGMNNKSIFRYSDQERWIEEAEKHFGEKNQKTFWNEIHSIDNLAWQFVNKNYKLPIRNLNDFIAISNPSNLKFIKLLKVLFSSVEKRIEKYKFSDNAFYKFLNEQLLITTQSKIDEAPYLTAAMGLAYPAETYYPYGGMYKPGELLMNYIIQNKAEIKFKEKVIELKQVNDFYEVKTMKGNSYKVKGIISNIPIWNMAKITEGNIQNYFNKYSDKYNSAWGAFTINFAVEAKDDLPSVYFQIHTEKEIPYCNSKSIFVSFSEKDDFEKAPLGFRTVTISIHTDVDNWYDLTKDEYEKRKELAANSILNIFDNYFAEKLGNEKLFLLSGTPNTFEFYTQREKGFVGGIPHSIKRNLMFMPPNVTPFENLYMVGDTVFPGQGTPAVILGALNVSKRIMDKK